MNYDNCDEKPADRNIAKAAPPLVAPGCKRWSRNYRIWSTRVLFCLPGCCSIEMFIGRDLLKEGFGAPRRSRRNKASILSSSLAGLL